MKDNLNCLRFCLGFAALSLCFISLLPVISSTEAREIHVARLMFEGESYVLPLRNGVVPSKPPLFHWVAQLPATLLQSADAFSVRLVSVLSALSMLLLLYAYVPRRRAALLAVFILAATPMFIRLSLDARVDMLFALCCYLAWIGGIHRQDPKWFWAAAAAAVLAKGPLGLLLPFILCAACMLWLRTGVDWLRRFLRPQAAHLFLLAPLAWYAAAFAIGAEDFLWRIRFENLDRFFEGAPGRPSGVETYAKAVLLKLAPWSWLAIVLFFRDLKTSLSTRRRSLRQGYACALLAAFGFFFLAAGKRDAYLLPLLPLLASYVACSAPPLSRVKRWLDDPGTRSRSMYLVSTLGMLAVFMLLLLGLSSFFSEVAARFSAYLWEHAVPLLLACALLSVATWYEQQRGRGITRLFPFAYILLFAYATGLGLKGSLKDFEGIATSIRDRVPVGQRLVIVKKQFEEYFDPLELLLERRLEHSRPAATLDCGGHFITRRPYFEGLSQSVQVLGEYRLLADRVRSRRERDIILFRCAGE